MPAENKVQTQSEADEKMVDLPNTGSSVDVEIADTAKTINSDEDTPAVETEVETASSEEMDDYGHKVQSRIDKLTKKLREAERREQAAVQYAQGVQKEALQINHKCLSNKCLDNLHLLVNLTQKLKIGLKRMNGLVQMNQ
jgi:hypothetical protein